MKRFVEICGLLVGVAILTMPAAAQTRVDLVERGRYIVETIAACGHCHTPQRLEDGRQVDLPHMHLAGGYGFDGPVLGRWAGTNITPDPDTGIGRWTDAQIAVAVRDGKRPAAEPIPTGADDFPVEGAADAARVQQVTHTTPIVTLRAGDLVG